MKLLTIAQVTVAVLLCIAILLQNRGSGLGAAYGDSFGGYYTKRGMEKFLFYSAIILGLLFVITSMAIIIVANR